MFSDDVTDLLLQLFATGAEAAASNSLWAPHYGIRRWGLLAVLPVKGSKPPASVQKPLKPVLPTTFQFYLPQMVLVDILSETRHHSAGTLQRHWCKQVRRIIAKILSVVLHFQCKETSSKSASNSGRPEAKYQRTDEHGYRSGSSGGGPSTSSASRYPEPERPDDSADIELSCVAYHNTLAGRHQFKKGKVKGIAETVLQTEASISALMVAKPETRVDPPLKFTCTLTDMDKLLGVIVTIAPKEGTPSLMKEISGLLKSFIPGVVTRHCDELLQ